MNAAMVRALFRDAVYQVLDNRVFRILAVGTLLLVAFTFAIGFRETEVVVLFGWRRYEYYDILAMFGLPTDAGLDHRLQVINELQQFFVDQVAGSLGMAFALAATAFFVPRMLERGLADGLLSKPIGRSVFYLTRFAAGLLFITLLALFLVGGVYLGFVLNSHYSDPGFLWAGVTLVYVFALLHGVSMLIGVWTRSTVASILLSLVFFLVNGCVHNVWIVKEWGPQEAIDGGTRGPPGSNQPEELVWLTNAFFTAVNVCHYVLPKTTDATVLTAKLRAAVERSEPMLRDSETTFAIQGLPEGFVRSEMPDPARLYLPRAGRTDGECLIAASWADDPAGAHVWIERSLKADDGLTRMTQRAEVLQAKLLQDQPGLKVRVRNVEVQDRGARAIEIVDDLAEPKRWTLVVLFNTPGPGRSTAFALVIETRQGWSYGRGEEDDVPEPAPAGGAAAADPFAASRAPYAVSNDFEEQLVLDTRRRGSGPVFKQWYAEQFRFDAPLRYNALFSIGSSVAFTLAVLGLGIWKLRRIDF